MTHDSNAPRRSATEQARLEAMARELFEHRLSFNELLGFKVTSFDPEATQIRFAMRPDLVGHYLYGRLHGGVISSALDTVGGLVVLLGVAEKYNNESTDQVAHRFGRIGTIDLRVDYLHQGIGEVFTATGRITRLGGRIASVQMTLENDDGILIATGSGAYVVS